jgi:hypothetical protein
MEEEEEGRVSFFFFLLSSLSSSLVRALLGRARALGEAGQFAKAIEVLSVPPAPAHPSVYQLRGLFKIEAADFSGAVGDFDLVLKDLDAARGCLGRAELVQVYHYSGEARAELGDTESSVRDLRSAVGLAELGSPERAEASLALARVLMKAARKREALEECKRIAKEERLGKEGKEELKLVKMFCEF